MSKPTDWLTLFTAAFAAYFALQTYKSRTKELKDKATLDRFKNYADLNEVMDLDPDRIAIHAALEDVRLWVTVTKKNKEGFLALHEQIALMLQSNLISEGVAFYSYAFDLMRVYKSDQFWQEFSEKDNRYWLLCYRLNQKFLAYEECHENRPFPVETYRF